MYSRIPGVLRVIEPSLKCWPKLTSWNRSLIGLVLSNRVGGNVVYGPPEPQFLFEIAWNNLLGRSGRNRISVDYHFSRSQDQHDCIHHSFPSMCRLEILSPSMRYSLRMLPYKAKAKGWLGGSNAWKPIRWLSLGVVHPNLLNKNPGNQEMGCWLVVVWYSESRGSKPERSPRCGSWLHASIAGYSERPLNFYVNL
jgi:hypothetical protein